MSNILTIGLLSEGKTDDRFLLPIIQRTCEEIAFECASEIEIYPPVSINKSGGSFPTQVKNATLKADKDGLMVLFVHADADASTNRDVLQYKIQPAFKAAKALGVNNCKCFVAVIPIYMTEAWMLADFELLREELGTSLLKSELGLQRSPESLTNPKEALINAIAITQHNKPKRRRNQLTISDLYRPVGQGTEISKLRELSSYRHFEEGLRQAFRDLNYLH
ncbi:MAG: DUF4276 family protein [Bacteroidota bacterium]